MAKEPHETRLHNQRAWDRMAETGHRFAKPASSSDFENPLASVDGPQWLGGDIRNWRVLCLAAGGGRQGPIYAAAGAIVTVVDFSPAMLAIDQEMAKTHRIALRTVETSMEDLSMFEAEEFDLVIHPVSTCYIANIARVYQQIARVLRGGGLYISQHKQPGSLQTSLVSHQGQYQLVSPYYRQQPLEPVASHQLVREPNTYEYIHRWEQLLGELCRAGFVIEDLTEPYHADPTAAVGSFEHRSQFVAPYVRIKARRRETNQPKKSDLIISV